MMNERFQTRISAYSAQVADYFVAYRSKVTAAITHQSMSRYQKYLASIFHSEWFKFSQRIFNNSEGAPAADSQRRLFLKNNSEIIDDHLRIEVDFGIFLEIEEVEAVLLWPIQFWDR